MRISEKNEDQKRAGHRQSPSPQRSQAPDGVNFKFTKRSRILARGHYQRVLQANRKLVGKSVAIDYRTGKAQCPKLGITVSRRYGKAHMRNRFKRVVREAFRQCRMQLPSDLEINIIPLKSVRPASPAEVLLDLAQLLKHIS